MKTTIKKFLLSFVTGAAVLFTACQVGLGAAVDTQVPELFITSPERTSIVKGPFTLKGTWNDDGTISSIQVVLTSSQRVAGTDAAKNWKYAGKVDTKDKTWTCRIDPFSSKNEIPDGTYNLDVTIFDNGGHSTLQSTVLTIDNTAPVIALTRPSSDDKTKPDTYGQDFIVSGYAADTTDAKYIKIKIYESESDAINGNAIYESEKTKVDSEFSVNFASFKDEKKSEVYKKIYGYNSSSTDKPNVFETKNLICSVTGYDDAVNFDDSNDKDGNSREYFYMYDGALYDDIFHIYGALNSYKILNGSFTESDRASVSGSGSKSIAVLTDMLEQDANHLKAVYFSLNPANNPSFKISGRTPLVKDPQDTNGHIFKNSMNEIRGENSLTKSTTIVVEVTPGLDNTVLEAGSLGLYVLECDDDGKVIGSSSSDIESEENIQKRQYIVKPLIKDKAGTEFPGLTDADISFRNESLSKSGSTYKFTVNITDEAPVSLTTGKNYLLYVDGFDKESIPVKNLTDVYGFFLSSGTASPVINITGTPAWITPNANRSATGTDTLSTTITIENGEPPFKIRRFVDGNIQNIKVLKEDFTEREFKDTYKIDADLKSGDGKHSITYQVSDKYVQTGSKIYEFKVDSTAPVTKGITVPSTMQTEEVSFRFGGKVEDEENGSGIYGVEYKLADEINNKATGWMEAAGTTTWNATVIFGDTDKTAGGDSLFDVFKKEGPKVIYVRTYDVAGNYSAEGKATFTYDKAAPLVAITAYEYKGTNVSLSNPSSFDAPGTFKMIGTASDNNGLDSVSVVQIIKDNGVDKEIPIPGVTFDKGTGNWSVDKLPRKLDNPIEPLEESKLSGTYSYKVTVKDYAGKYVSQSVKVVIDREAPILTVISPAENSNFAGETSISETAVFRGTVKDAEGGVGTRRYSYAFSETADVPAADSSLWFNVENCGDGAWTFAKDVIVGNENGQNGELHEGHWYFFIKAEDYAGNKTDVVKRDFWVDLDAPYINADIIQDANQIYYGGVYYYKDNAPLKFKVNKIYDTLGPGEGVSVFYQLGDAEKKNFGEKYPLNLTWTNKAGYIDDKPGVKAWGVDEITISDKVLFSEVEADKRRTLRIGVVDKSGKERANEFTIFRDTAAPEIVVENPAESAQIEGSITANGTFKEDGRGIKEFKYKFNDATEWTTKDNTANASSDTWNVPIEVAANAPEGQISLTIMAVDYFGHESEAYTRSFFYDKTAPSTTIKFGDSEVEGLVTKDGVTLKGTAEDTYGIKKIEVKDKNNRIYLLKDNLSSKTYDWSVELKPGNDSQSLVDGKYELVVIVTDLSGRATTYNRDLMIDTSAPTVTDVKFGSDLLKFETDGSGKVTKLTATVTDALSGIESVDYIITNSSEKPGIDTAGWQPLSQGVASWSETINFVEISDVTDGNWYGYIRVKDAAGNVAVSNDKATTYIDTKAPEIKVEGAQNNDLVKNTGLIITLKVLDYNPTAPKITAKRGNTVIWNEIAVSGTGTDIGGGVQGKKWTVTLPFGTRDSGFDVDGEYEFTINAADTKNRSAKTESFTLRRDAGLPEITSASFAAENGLLFLDIGQTSRLTVSAKDNDGGSGLESVKYNLTTSSAAPAESDANWKSLQLSQGKYIDDINFTGKTDGQYYAHIMAKDNAGNVLRGTVNAPIYIDTKVPVITVTGETSVQTAAAQTYTITVDDVNPTKPVVKIKKNGETGDGTSLEPSGSGNNWTVNVPFNTADYGDGDYILTVNAKDTKDRPAQQKTLNILKDVTSPTVNVEAVSTTGFTNSNIVTFRGTATDEHLDTVTAVLYKGTSPAVAGEASEITATLQPDNDGNWTWKVYDLLNAKYYVVVTAKDRVGRSTVKTGGTVTVDTTPPTSTYLLSSGMLYSSAGVDDKHPVNSNESVSGITYYTNEAYGFTGEVSDANFDKITVNVDKITVNGGSLTVDSNNKWTVTGVTSAQGPHEYAFVVIDKAGNRTSQTVTVIYDTAAPELDVRTPAAGESFDNASVTLKGTIEDAGIGVNSLKYSINGGTEQDINLSGKNWTKDINLGETEGTFKITFTAEDKLGKTYEESARTFYYDKAAPVVTESGASTRSVNDSFTLSGTVTESNGISKVIVKDGDTTIATLTTEDSGGITGSNSTGYNWTYTISIDTTNHTQDGTHQYTIQAVDIANKTSTVLTRTVTVDTTAPSVTDGKFTSSVIKLDESEWETISVTAADPANGTGLAGVYYHVSSAYYTLEQLKGLTNDSWSSMSRGTDGWKATSSFKSYSETAGNQYYSYFKAEDNAGNITYFRGTTAKLDKTAPKLSVKFGDETGTEFKTKTTNNSLEVTVTDTNVSKLYVDGTETNVTPSDVKDDSNNVIGKKYIIPVTTSSGATKSLALKAEDANGRTVEQTVKMECDTVPPVVTLTSYPSSGYHKTNSLTIEGEAKDEHIDNVSVEIEAPDGTKTSAQVTGSKTGTGADTTYTWTAKLYNLTDAKYKVYIVAKDTFGNTENKITDTNGDRVAPADVTIDCVAPILNFAFKEGTNFYDATGASIAASNIAANNTYYTKGGFGLSGSVVEQNYDASKIYVKYGENLIPIGDASKYLNYDWSYVDAEHSDGEYNYEITAEDLAGNKDIKKITIICDTSAPEIELKSPAENESFQGQTISINGTVTDDGIGVASLEYAVRRDTTTPGDSEWKSLTVTGRSFKANETVTSEGDVYISIRAKDKLGYSKEISKRKFFYDAAAPDLREVHGNSTLVTNAAFTLNGTVTETNGLDKIEIKDENNAIVATLTTATGGGITGSSTSGYTWTKKFPVTGTGAIADGNHSYTITATDVALKESSPVVRMVRVDTTAPSFTAGGFVFDDSNKAGTYTNIIMLDESLDAKLTTTVGDGDGTGVSRVYYLVQKSTATAPTVETQASFTWTAMSQGASDWTATYKFAKAADETGYKVYYKAEDSAGNISVYNGTNTATVDKTVPVVSAIFNGKEVTTFAANKTDVNADGELSFKVKVADTNAATLTATGCGAECSDITPAGSTGFKQYKVTVKPTTDGSTNTVVITGKDANSRESEKTLTITCDIVPPVLTVDSYNEFISEDSITLTGTVDDANLDAVTVVLTNVSNPSDTKEGKVTTEAISGEATKRKWTAKVYDLDGKFNVSVKAKDTYGNETTAANTPAIELDRIAPTSTLTITESTNGVYGADGKVTTTFANGGKYYVKGEYTITGTIIETNFDKTKVTVSGATSSITVNDDKTWSITGVTGDGIKEYEVEINDKAGNKNELKFTVVYDTAAPSFTITNPETDLSGDDSLSGTSYTFRGNGSDATAGICNGYYYKFTQTELTESDVKADGYNFTTNGWTHETSQNLSKAYDLISGSSSTMAGSQLREGQWYLYVFAKDYVNNKTLVKRSFFVDKKVPELSFDIYKADGADYTTVSQTNDSVYVKGTASDTNGVKNVALYLDGKVLTASGYKTPGEGVTPKDVSSEFASTDGIKFTNEKTKASGATADLADGNHTISLTVTDVAGKTTTKEKTVLIDTTAPAGTPVITTTSPVNGWYNTKNISVKYSYSPEQGKATSGVKSVRMKAFTETQTSIDFDTGSSTLYLQGSDYTGNLVLSNDGTNYIYVELLDNVGNRNVPMLTAAVDTTAPVIGAVKHDENTLAAGATYYYKKDSNPEKLTITGTLTEVGSGINSVKVNGVEISGSLTGEGTTKNWLTEISGIEPGTEKAFDIVVTDNAGNTDTKTYKIYNDTLAPTVEITAPDSDLSGENSLSGTRYTFRGNADDAGSGLKVFKYKFTRTQITGDDAAAVSANIKADVTATATAADWTAPTGTTFTAAKDLVSVMATGKLHEGAWYLYAYAEDNAGNYATATRSFWIDLSAPVLTVAAVDSQATPQSVVGGVTNTAIKVSGTASDANGLEGNAVKVKIDGTAKESIAVSTGSLTATTYTVTGDSPDLTNGRHTFEITAKDKSGKETSKSFDVLVDTKAPVATEIGLTKYKADSAASGYQTFDGKKWYRQSRIAVSVNGVSDENGDVEVSGVDTVEAWVGDDEPVTLRLAGTTYSGNLNLEEGENTISVKVTDKAGNESSVITKIVYLDSTEAEVCSVYELNAEGKLVEVEGSKTVNGKSELKFYVKAAEFEDEKAQNPDASGIASVVYRYGNTKNGSGVYTDEISANLVKAAGVTKGYYEVIIPENGTTIYQKKGYAKFVVTDKVGNEFNATPFSFSMDTQAPELTIGTILDAYTVADGDKTDNIDVNGTLEFSGTATDGTAVKSVTVQYFVSENTADEGETPVWTPLPAGWSDTRAKLTATGVIDADVDGTSNWTATIDTTALTDESKLHIRAIAADTAGNISVVKTAEVYINQDTDRPIITFNNVDLSQAKPSLKSSSQVFGIIKDDDGIKDNKFWYKKSGDANYTAVSVSNGSWYINLEDGSYIIDFKVTDTKNTEFSTESGETLTPKLTSLGLTTPKSDSLELLVDKTPPEYKNRKFAVYAEDKVIGETTTPTKADGTAVTSDDYKDQISDLVFGGINNKFSVQLEAKDANGIKSVDVYFEGDEAHKKTVTQKSGTAGTNNEWDVWTVNGIDTTGMNGNQTVYIKVTDNAELSTTITMAINVDNMAPGITFTSHANGATVYATNRVAVIGAVSGNDVRNWYYAVTKVDEGQSPTAPAENSAEWKELPSGVTFEVDFDDGSDEPGKIHETTLFKKICKMEQREGQPVPTELSDVARDIYFWAYAVDNAGNKSDKTSLHLNVIPNGDKPSVAFTYPTATGAALGGTIRLSGSAEIQTNTIEAVYLQLDVQDMYSKNASGTYYAETVTDNGVSKTRYRLYEGVRYTESGGVYTEAADGTYIKVGDNYYLAADKLYVRNTPTFDVANWESNISAQASRYTIVDTGLLAAGVQGGSAVNNGFTRGIKASGTASWNLPINGNKEFNLENKYILLRVFAKSDSGKHSDPVVYYVTIDPDAPTVGSTKPLKLVQYEAGHVGDDDYITATQAYTADMWVKGQWYLTGSVEDDNGLKEIVFEDEKGETHDLVSITDSENNKGEKVTEGVYKDYVKTGTKIDDKNYNYELCIPVGSTKADSFGKLSYKITATEGTGQNLNTETSITLNYDNMNPVFRATGADVISATNKLGVNEFASSGNDIKQQNGMYTVYGVFDEAGNLSNNQSGFKRIAMYFTRTLTGDSDAGTYIIDPMLPQNANSHTYGRGNFIKDDTEGENPTLVKKEGLFWKKNKAAISGNNTLTFDSAVSDNVRLGGLVQIDNVSYKIKSISSDKKTVGIDGSVDDTTGTNKKDILFALAQIIDNTTTETGTTAAYGATSNVTNDDGDQMVEGCSIQGTTVAWQAGINSNLILDGPVTIHYVAYDAAGNYTVKSYDGNVKNNAPRLYGVKYGTDRDGSGEITGDEWITTQKFTVTESEVEYHGYEGTTGTPVYTINIDPTKAKRLTVKGLTTVIPQIAGGNIDLGYTIEQTDDTEENPTAKPVKVNTVTYWKDDTDKSIAGHSNATTARNDGQTPPSYDIFPITLETRDFIDGTYKVADGNKTLTYKIWDKTDGTTIGSNSNVATVIIPVTVAVQDETPPTVKFEEFFWNSSSDNSLYGNSTANGHIELKDDLTFTGSPFTASTGLMDKDPKVSGAITFCGEAKDNVIVNEIKMTIPGFNSDNAFTIATRNSGVWTSDHLLKRGDDPTTEAIEALTYADYAFSETVPWYFELVKDAYSDEDGSNTVTFKFHFDTTKVQGVAKLDVGVSLAASDRGKAKIDQTQTGGIGYDKNSSAAGSTVATGLYKVDVVPYITGISTRLDSLKSGNTSVYNRTVKGHYPVMDNETVTITGFNLNSSGATSITKAISEITTSGEFAVTVTNGSDNITSLNNSNNNQAKGAYTGTVAADKAKIGDKSVYENYYNRKPNGDSNENLTDDVYFDIYHIKKGAYPVRGSLTEPVMRVNPVNDMLGFAFTNGPDLFSMPTGVDAKQFSLYGNVTTNATSYYRWQYNYADFNAIGFTFDANGHAHATSAGLDTEPSKDYAGKFSYLYSGWGPGRIAYTTNADNYKEDNYLGISANRLESVGVPSGTTVGGSSISKAIIDTHRIRSPSIATSIHDGYTSVYLAYYDDIQQQIRFRHGDLSNTATSKTNFGDFVDENGNAAKESGADNFSLIAGKEGDNSGNTYQTAGEYIAIDVVPNIEVANTTEGALKDGITCYEGTYQEAVSSPKYRWVTTAANENIAGKEVVFLDADKKRLGIGTLGSDHEHSTWNNNDFYRISNSISGTPKYVVPAEFAEFNQVAAQGTTTSDIVIAVWYDGNNCKYSYTVNPTNETNLGRPGTSWSKPETIFTDGGEYCTVKVDAKGGIHISAYDTNKADLKYAYLSSYDAAYSESTQAVTVDSYAIVGQEIMIDTYVTSENGTEQVVPTISYYMPSIQKVKIARPVLPSSGAIDRTLPGADASNEKYTGDWEISVIPTQSKVQADHTSIGYWKKSDGTLKPASSTSETGKITVGSDSGITSGSTSGVCYGNGTQNPAIAYAIKENTSGAIEVAQMK